MSSLRNAIPRKAHKERAQPHSRRKYGLLEKHKDYVHRARAYQQKKQTLQKLKEKAAFRNPDEFYFKMIKTKTVRGVHRPESEANKYSPEELMLMKTQDIGYISQKLQAEKKKIEKLNSMLHSLDNQSSGKHVYFAEDRDEAQEMQDKFSTERRENPSFEDLPKVIKKDEAQEMQDKFSTERRENPSFEDLPKVIKKKIASSYRELENRKSRVQQLEKICMDMSLQKELQKKGKKRKTS